LFIDPLAVDVGRYSGDSKDKQKSGSKKQLFCHVASWASRMIGMLHEGLFFPISGPEYVW
jgi:hypothetical protein